MYMDNAEALRSFLKVFSDGVFLMGLCHVIYFLAYRILSKKNTSFFLCAVAFLIYGTESIFDAGSFEMRAFYTGAYLLSYMIYRNSLFYLTEYVIKGISTALYKSFTFIFRPMTALAGKFCLKAENIAKKARKLSTSLLQNGKKVYNKYVTYFSCTRRRNERKKEQKTEEG